MAIMIFPHKGYDDFLNRTSLRAVPNAETTCLFLYHKTLCKPFLPMQYFLGAWQSIYPINPCLLLSLIRAGFLWSTSEQPRDELLASGRATNSVTIAGAPCASMMQPPQAISPRPQRPSSRGPVTCGSGTETTESGRWGRDPTLGRCYYHPAAPRPPPWLEKGRRQSTARSGRLHP